MKMRLAILAAVIGFSILPMGPSLRQAPAPATEAAGKFAANAPSEAIPNLDGEKAQLKQYHDCTCKCGCYANDLDLQAGRAIEFLRRRVAHRAGDEKLALVLDIDETTLSNYEEMAGADFAYDSDVFNAWVNSAKAPAIPGTLRVYLEAQRRGVSVFFLTGRPESQRAVTEQNLHNAAFQNWQRLILRPPTQASATAQIFKSAARAQIAAQGYKLILNIGDQWSDLKGDSEAEYSVKYPDPFYFIK
jgi:acid phosphatase